MKDKSNQDNTIPRYLQIKKLLKQEILSSPQGSKFTAERELAKRYKVAYMTIRRAVNELVDEGLLYRQQGRGTFISEIGRIATKTHSIGFFVSHGFDITNPYFSLIFSGIEVECRKHNYSVFFSAKPEDLIPMGEGREGSQTRRKVDGIIAVHLRASLEPLRQIMRYVPVVVVGYAGAELDIPSIAVDHAAGARKAVEHLVGLGHKRIAHISGPLDTPVAQQRQETYLTVLQEAGISSASELIIEGDFGFKVGYEAAKKFLALPEPPTAIFAANDTSAIGAIRGAYESGLAVPGDVSVVGFDDTNQAEQWDLTTIRVEKEEIGHIAFSLIREMIETGELAEGNLKTVVPTQLIERKSCRRIE